MVNKDELAKKITSYLIGVLDSDTYEIDSVRIIGSSKKPVIDLRVDRVDGRISIDECAQINKQLSFGFESKQWIDGSYVIEVSSPGLDKKLEKDSDFEKLIGHDLDIKYRDSSGTVLRDTFELRGVDSGKLDCAAGVGSSDLKTVSIKITDILKAVQAIKI